MAPPGHSGVKPKDRNSTQVYGATPKLVDTPLLNFSGQLRIARHLRKLHERKMEVRIINKKPTYRAQRLGKKNITRILPISSDRLEKIVYSRNKIKML